MKATRQGMAMDMRSFEIGWNEADTPVLLRKPKEYPEEYVYQEYGERRSMPELRSVRQTMRLTGSFMYCGCRLEALYESKAVKNKVGGED